MLKAITTALAVRAPPTKARAGLSHHGRGAKASLSSRPRLSTCPLRAKALALQASASTSLALSLRSKSVRHKGRSKTLVLRHSLASTQGADATNATNAK